MFLPHVYLNLLAWVEIVLSRALLCILLQFGRAYACTKVYGLENEPFVGTFDHNHNIFFAAHELVYV